MYQLYQPLSCTSPSNKTKQQNPSFLKSDHPLDTLVDRLLSESDVNAPVFTNGNTKTKN